MTELSLGQIFQIARRWWWILLFGPIIGGLIGWTMASQAQPVYQADAKLLLDRPTVDASTETSASAYNNILAAERQTQTFGQLVETRVVLSEALTRMGENAGVLTVDGLKENLTVTVVPETQIIQIDATDEDPDRAALIVNSISEVFIEYASAFRPEVSTDNSTALQASIDDIVEDMEMTQGQIAALESGDDAASATVQAQLRDLRTLLGEYQSRHAELVEIQQRMTLTAAESGILISVVDPAVAADIPIGANPAFTVFLGLLAGIGIAGGIVFILGYLDNTVKDPATAQRVTGHSTLGLIPAISRPERFDALNDLGIQPAEAFRTLRTNLQFATLGKVVRSIVMTSGRAGDGTTTTASYLAMVLAQGGQRVILVDANLRNPTLHHLVGLPNRTGLTSLLLGDSMENLDDYLRSTDVDQLQILTSGPLPPNPSDLLNSQRTEDLIRHLELRADLIIFDCPSLEYADALILTGMASGSLVVATARKTRSNELAEAVAALQQTEKPIFGTVLNRVQAPKGKVKSPAHLTPAVKEYEEFVPSRRAPSKRRRLLGFRSR